VNLETGEVERPATANHCVQTYPTRVQDGVLQIDVRDSRVEAERSIPAGAIA
jgi:hypothetical protein